MATAGSPQLRSPLIGERDAVDGPDSKRAQNGSLSPKDQTWKLRYEDFCPVLTSDHKIAKGQTFQSLVDKANSWLKSKRDLIVRTCETLPRYSTDLTDLRHRDLSIQRRSLSASHPTHSMRCLRLWLVPRDRHTKYRVSKIAFHDFVPEKEENISKLSERVTEKVDSGEIKGKIVTVETMIAPEFNGEFNTDGLMYTDQPEKDSLCALALRVFSVSENVAKEKIEVRDFVPRLRDHGYEEFGLLVDRANDWLQNQSGIRILNMQSVMVQKDLGPHSETGSNCFFTLPGTESDAETEWFRILRIPYAQLSDNANGITEDRVASPINYEMFTPTVLKESESGKPRIERTSEVFAQVSQFLLESGAQIVSAETVLNPMQCVEDEEDHAFKWLHSLRIYYTGGGAYDDDGLIDPKDLANHGKNRHPGPIFLGTITGRQHRYRWIFVGILAFACVGLIVFLGIYYSRGV